MKFEDKAALEERCRELGARECKIIDIKTIKISHWPRYKCQYGCGDYGNTLCCPPHSPGPEETKKILEDYTGALLVRFPGEISVTEALVKLEKELFSKNYYKAISFGAGPCTLCESCNLEKCLHPGEARPSMESCGIDVFSTVRANGFNIDVIVRDSEGSRYGLLLIE